MKFNDALKQKAFYGNTIIKNGLTFNIYVVPKNINDQARWLNEFKEESVTDNTAKAYSTDNQFSLYLKMAKESLLKLGIR